MALSSRLHGQNASRLQEYGNDETEGGGDGERRTGRNLRKTVVYRVDCLCRLQMRTRCQRESTPSYRCRHGRPAVRAGGRYRWAMMIKIGLLHGISDLPSPQLRHGPAPQASLRMEEP